MVETTKLDDSQPIPLDNHTSIKINVITLVTKLEPSHKTSLVYTRLAILRHPSKGNIPFDTGARHQSGPSEWYMGRYGRTLVSAYHDLILTDSDVYRTFATSKH